MPDDAPWAEPVVVPDDLRSLQADVDAYHRELRHARRRNRLRRVTGSRAWQRLALPVAATLGALAMGAVVFATLTFGQPQPRAPLVAAPLASAPVATADRPHGLLPDVTVTTANEGSMSIRDVRPALVALVPLHCACTDLLKRLAGQADEVSLPLVAVAPAAQDAEVAALAGALHLGRADPVFDAAGRLAAAFGARGVTAVGVAADGTVGFVRYDVQPDDQLELYLQALTAPSGIVTG